MNKKIIYSKKLGELVRDKHYIPKRIDKNDRLKCFHRYWCDFSESFFKVDRIYKVNSCEYYSVKYDNLLFGEIPYPLGSDFIYELPLDNDNIHKLDIINTNIKLLGSEIKYWFFINNIDFNNPRFSGFWPFLNPNSKSLISDDKYYYTFARDIDNGNHRSCSISLDRGSNYKKKRRRKQ